MQGADSIATERYRQKEAAQGAGPSINAQLSWQRVGSGSRRCLENGHGGDPAAHHLAYLEGDAVQYDAVVDSGLVAKLLVENGVQGGVVIGIQLDVVGITHVFHGGGALEPEGNVRQSIRHRCHRL